MHEQKQLILSCPGFEPVAVAATPTGSVIQKIIRFSKNILLARTLIRFQFEIQTNEGERPSRRTGLCLWEKQTLTMLCWYSEDLQQRLAGLEQERAEFLRLKQQLEAEFNQKRAKFKELYLSKEGKDPSFSLYTLTVMNSPGRMEGQRVFSFLPRGAEEAERSVGGYPGWARRRPEPARCRPFRDRNYQGGGHGVWKHQAGSHRPDPQPVAGGGGLAAGHHER